MDYINAFSFRVEKLPPSAFRLIFLNSQNDGISQNVIFHVRCFGVENYDISSWGLKKAKIYFKNNLLHSGLLVSGKNYTQEEYEGFYYEFTIASPLYLFKTRGSNRVFVNKTPEEIINAVFLSAGWNAHQWRWTVSNNLPVLSYRVQYNQTDYDFIMELLADYKLHFIFDQGILRLVDNIKYLNKNYTYKTHRVEEHQAYECQLSQQFLGYQFKKRSAASLLKAVVEGLDFNTPYMDHRGYYFIRFLFDESSELLQGSCPVPVITPGLMNFTLKPGTEVAVRFLDGDINQPVIVGVFLKQARPPGQYIHKSHAGHEFVLSEEAIKMTHANLANKINLGEEISVLSQQGGIAVEAGKDCRVSCQESIFQEVQKDQVIAVSNKQVVKVREGYIDFQAAKNGSFSANDKILFNASEKVNFKANSCNITAENINITGKNKVEWVSAQKINCFGSKGVEIKSEGAVLFQVPGAGMMSTPAGLFLNTALLNINAFEIVGIQML